MSNESTRESAERLKSTLNELAFLMVVFLSTICTTEVVPTLRPSRMNKSFASPLHSARIDVEKMRGSTRRVVPRKLCLYFCQVTLELAEKRPRATSRENKDMIKVPLGSLEIWWSD